MSAPLGIRNNNLGNIRWNDSTHWAGQIQNVGGFVQFLDPAYGIRAMFMVYASYKKNHHINTLRAFVSRWAPPEDDNDTEIYISVLSSKTGIKPDQIIDLQDHDTAIKIAKEQGIIEQGANPKAYGHPDYWYDDQTFETGYNLAYPHGYSVSP